MRDADDKPLSALVAQGWEVIGFTSARDPSWGTHAHHVLLRRQRAHKVLSIRAKAIGSGHVVKEIDL
ncbi:MAG: hypothetical protein JNL41_09865 [Phenylobacterium sp.]|uniref:hypothetical protein n=1 Tax=Phenylobacterium sp. TaxID=1871053 RepID=UPI001A493876|nr:hypothetical protein [Phenylobacterium sp.]MBL8554571.1 hypothetical protein [Phenylobacterium sp.]